MEIMGFVAVPAITIICYLLAEIFKAAAKEEQYKFIPVLVGLCGAILGGLAFVYFVGYLTAENIMEAVAIGIVSGLAATGVNQLVKQFGSDE